VSAFEVDDFYFSHGRFLNIILLGLVEKSVCTPKVQDAWGTGGGNLMTFCVV
jgi:hypothetical protein